MEVYYADWTQRQRSLLLSSLTGSTILCLPLGLYMLKRSRCLSKLATLSSTPTSTVQLFLWTTKMGQQLFTNILSNATREELLNRCCIGSSWRSVVSAVPFNYCQKHLLIISSKLVGGPVDRLIQDSSADLEGSFLLAGRKRRTIYVQAKTSNQPRRDSSASSRMWYKET